MIFLNIQFFFYVFLEFSILRILSHTSYSDVYPILCVPGAYSADSLNWIEKEAVGKIRVVHHADGYSCRRASRKLLYAGNTSFISRSISIATILGSGINCPELFPRLFACSILVVLGEFLRRWWEKRKYQETTMILSSGISSVAPIRRYIRAL